jgi:thymidine kinase
MDTLRIYSFKTIRKTHKRNGHISLKALSTWNRKIPSIKTVCFQCKKQHHLLPLK